MNKRLQLSLYLISDFFVSGISWTLFYMFRKLVIETQKFGIQVPLNFGTRYFVALSVIPIFWIVIYHSSGYYKSIFRKSRLSELWTTLLNTLFGVLILFFAIILDDTIKTYQDYYISILSFIGIHFTLTYIPRLIITSRTTAKIHSGEWGFNTLLIGGTQEALEIYNEIRGQKRSSGNRFVGFVNVLEKDSFALSGILSHLGSVNNLKDIIHKYKIEECIITLDTKEQEKTGLIIGKLSDLDIVIKAIPSMLDIISGKVRMSNVLGTPLVEITHELMPKWQENIKQFLDIVVSVIAIILASPLYIFLSIAIKISSPGPVFYMHERIGRYGKPFRIIKFRSMHVNAETNGPELSSENDPRVTKLGKFMRKYRFDEIPNFINVLKGDMSLVGPRPERKFFIDQIVEKAPHYRKLSKVKPGITSWGQVKFGYAQNIDEMVRRMNYDLLYVENMSLYLDFKILIYTVLTILRAKGV
jgi:exopolysaccharide biosynthesis polyprenyl glycosylphosphotransferase